MAYDLRDHRVCYDNIAVGSAITDEEHHVAVGEDPPAQTYGQGENIAVASDYGEENTTAVATDPPDEIIG